MKRNALIATGLAAAAILIISYCHFQSSPEKNSATTVEPESMGSLPPSENAGSQQPTGESASAGTSGAGFLPTQMEDSEKFASYQKHLKEMAVCLNMAMNPLDPQAEINFETLNKVISPDLGDIVTTSDEWTATDIRTKSGEIRRILIQNSPDVDAESQRTLKYYSLGVDGQKELPLSQEQMANPSDALIASLEADGEPVAHSVSRRIYYQNGDDLLYVERNGKLFSFELPHDGKTFTCTNADTAQMTCKCR